MGKYSESREKKAKDKQFLFYKNAAEDSLLSIRRERSRMKNKGALCFSETHPILRARRARNMDAERKINFEGTAYCEPVGREIWDAERKILF